MGFVNHWWFEDNYECSKPILRHIDETKARLAPVYPEGDILYAALIFVEYLDNEDPIFDSTPGIPYLSDDGLNKVNELLGYDVRTVYN